MRPVPMCPLRPGESCTLCNPGATGPEDCPTVYAVMTDPELRLRLAQLRELERRERAGESLTAEARSAPR